MEIILDNVSKRYTHHWVLKNVSLDFTSRHIYSIIGPNGSGKSTLLQMLSGYLSPSAGKITYLKDKDKIDRDDIFKYCAIWGPYVDLVGTLKLEEMVDYYYSFKKRLPQVSIDKFYNLLGLDQHRQSRVESLSSGQRQRLGLALTILSDAQIILLDEPGSFLDSDGLQWYLKLVHKYHSYRIVIISSNDVMDFPQSSNKMIDIQEYK